MINTMDETGFLIDGAIRLNQVNRWKIMSDGIHLSMSPTRFVEEFGTVSFNIGRRTGLSTYIAQNAKAQDVVITINGYMAYLYRSDYGCVLPSDVVSYLYLDSNYRDCKWYNNTIFWIDNYSLMSSEVDRVLGPFITSHYQTIVKLG